MGQSQLDQRPIISLLRRAYNNSQAESLARAAGILCEDEWPSVGSRSNHYPTPCLYQSMEHTKFVRFYQVMVPITGVALVRISARRSQNRRSPAGYRMRCCSSAAQPGGWGNPCLCEVEVLALCVAAVSNIAHAKNASEAFRCSIFYDYEKCGVQKSESLSRITNMLLN